MRGRQYSICSIFCHNVAPCSFSNEDLELICQLYKRKGDNVSVPVPDVDRGRSDFRKISGAVTSVGQDGIYTIDTKQGVLKQSFVRSQFIPSKGSFLNIEDVP